MFVRPLCIMAFGFVLGILVAATKNNWLYLPVFGIFFLLAGRIKKQKSRPFAIGTLLFYVICFLLGAYRCQYEQEFAQAYSSALCDNMRITLQGKLEEKEYKNDTYLYHLKDCYIDSEQGILPCNQVIAEVTCDEAAIGSVLVMEGSVSVFRQSLNEGNFDEASFYKSQKIAFKLEKSVIKAKYGKENVFRENLFSLREHLKKVYEACMSAEDSGVLTMMILGDKSLMDQEIKALYQKVGISHVLAISGLHISVIGMTLYKLLRRVCGSFWLSGIAAGALMLTYGSMTGFRASSTRAILMFLLMLIAQALGRSYDSLSALSFAALVLLWENPFLLYYAGFLFSFSAVIAVVFVSKILAKTFEKRKKVRDAVYSGLCIQFLTLPLTAYFYFEIPIYGMFVNFFVLPLMSAVLFFGLIGGFAGLVWLNAAKFLLLPCKVILFFYQWLSGMAQKLPGAVLITGQPEIERLLCYFGLLFGLLYWASQKKKGYGFGIGGILLLIFVLHIPKSGMELDVLDVGQGDGIYLRTENGIHLFIDGGSTNVSKAGTYRILPFLKVKGVRRIDYWFVTHSDKDHISGLQEVLEAEYPVRNLVFAENIVKDESYEMLETAAEAVGTKLLFMEYGDCLHIGEAELTCMFPYEDFETDDKNAASLVLLYEEKGFSGLFTGDIGTAEEQWIAQELTKNRDFVQGVTFYKAAHHGSNYSNSEELLSALQPEIIAVSCSKNNTYGHPGKDAVARMQTCGAELFYTMEAGQIKIKRKGDEVIVEKYLMPLDVFSFPMLK